MWSNRWVIYSSKFINRLSIAIVAIAVIAACVILFRTPSEPVVEYRPEICKELDLALDLREGASDRQLRMQSEHERDERCKRIMRGIPR